MWNINDGLCKPYDYTRVYKALEGCNSLLLFSVISILEKPTDLHPREKAKSSHAKTNYVKNYKKVLEVKNYYGNI